jgi:hypothetical protein
MEKYCSKCGSKEYFLEKRDKLEFYELKYALLVKQERENTGISNKKTQVWVDEQQWANFIPLKLIPSLIK